MQVKISILFILSILCITINAQPSICGSPPVMQNDCASACAVCDLDGMVSWSGNTVPGDAPPGYCTMIVHSIRYIAFVAGSVNLTINVTVNTCTLGNSIELGIYESPDCSAFDLVSNCNTFMPVGQTFTFSNIKPLKVGCYYYIVIDGNGPAICEYSVKVISGSAKAPTVKIQNIDGPRKVCVGETAIYSMANQTGGCELEWMVTNGTIVSSNNSQVEVLWSNPGTGKVCATAKNLCSQDSKCIDIIINPDSPPVNYDAKVCPNEYYDLNGILYGPGQHEVHLKNHNGCDSTINLNIEEYPPVHKVIDTVVCFPNCLNVQSQKLCQSGIYELRSKSKVAPFCDSITDLNLEIIKVVPKIYVRDSFSCTKNKVRLFADSSEVDTFGNVVYTWFDKNKKTIGTGVFIDVDSASLYTLRIDFISINGKFCTQESSIRLNNNAQKPNIANTGPILKCPGESQNLYQLLIIDSSNTNPLFRFYRDKFLSFKIDTSIIITNDSLIYVVADRGGCLDTGTVLFKLKPNPQINLLSSDVCEGTLIDRNHIRLQNLNAVDSFSTFLNCSKNDINCVVQFPFVLNMDSTLFIYAFKNSCTVLDSITIHAKEQPVLSGKLNDSLFCVGDLIQLKLNPRKSKEDRIIFINSDTLSLDKDIYDLPNTTEGKFKLKIGARIDQCFDSLNFSYIINKPEDFPDVKCHSTDTSIAFYWKSNLITHDFSYENLSQHNIDIISKDSIYFSNLNAGDSVRLKFVLHDSICGDQSKELLCEAVNCVPFGLNIVVPDTICLDTSNQTFKLSAIINNPLPNANQRWSGRGIVDTSNGIFDAHVAGAGLHKVRFTYWKKTCLESVEKNIIVRHKPDVRFQIDSIVCQDSTVYLHYIGVDSLFDTFNWLFDNADQQLIKIDKEFYLKWKNKGKKKITLNLQSRRCADFLEKEINVIPNPEIPKLICFPSDSSVSFVWNTQNDIKSFDPISLNGKNFIRLNDTSLIIKNLLPGEKVKIKLKALALSPCTDTENELECETKPCSKLNLLDEKIKTLCEKDVQNGINLNQYLLEQTDRIQWNNSEVSSGGFWANPKTGNTCITCTALKAGCNYIDTLCFLIDKDPVINLQSKLNYCPDDPELAYIHLNSILFGFTPFKIIINGKDESGNTNFDQLSEGLYKIIISDSLNCQFDTSLQIHKFPTPLLDVGPDLILKKLQAYTLHATCSNNINNIIWIPSDGLNCSNCFDPVVKTDKNILYKAIVTDSNGCIATDEVFIQIIENKVWVPNIISSNGDGLNDHFGIFGTDQLDKISLLQIYDRWGEQVFASENVIVNKPETGWDGRYRGNSLNPGVYVFYAELKFKNGEEEKIKGEFTLIR